MPDFTFATYEALPNLDPDDRLAVEALKTRGLSVRAAVWNDPQAAWEGRVIIRSTWDYHLQPEAFLNWAEARPLLTNPVAAVRWNVRKTYLRDLAERGAPVVPTLWLDPGDELELPWPRAVLKPCVGLATYGVRVVEDRRAGGVDQLTLAQPFLRSVQDYGERALVFIGGDFSHAVRKTAFQALAVAGRMGENLARVEDDELLAAREALARVDVPWLYARVDLVRDDHGRPLVLELELVEPSLFLSLYPPAAERLADALAELL